MDTESRMGEVCLDVAGSSEGPVEDALTLARQIQVSAADVGFDWTEIADVIAKVREEVEEIEEALGEGDLSSARHELGDLLFAAVNLSRFLDADPRGELLGANMRFSKRFSLLREEIARQGLAISDCTLTELDVVWERVKMRLAASSSGTA